MIEVVAALLRRDDKFLICQRQKDKARPLLWEFPGGKVEMGESKQRALVRECIEELNIIVDVGDIYMQVVHEYPDIKIRLSLLEAVIKTGQLRKKEHKALAWIKREDIPLYEFCPADIDIIKKLYNEG